MDIMEKNGWHRGQCLICGKEHWLKETRAFESYAGVGWYPCVQSDCDGSFEREIRKSAIEHLNKNNNKRPTC